MEPDAYISTYSCLFYFPAENGVVHFVKGLGKVKVDCVNGTTRLKDPGDDFNLVKQLGEGGFALEETMLVCWEQVVFV